MKKMRLRRFFDGITPFTILSYEVVKRASRMQAKNEEFFPLYVCFSVPFFSICVSVCSLHTCPFILTLHDFMFLFVSLFSPFIPVYLSRSVYFSITSFHFTFYLWLYFSIYVSVSSVALFIHDHLFVFSLEIIILQHQLKKILNLTIFILTKKPNFIFILFYCFEIKLKWKTRIQLILEFDEADFFVSQRKVLLES